LRGFILKAPFTLAACGLLITGLVAGCATEGDVAKVANEKEKKEFVTGSNLPQRDRSKSGVVNVDAEALERARQNATVQSVPRGN
jgi:hypothetical protein